MVKLFLEIETVGWRTTLSIFVVQSGVKMILDVEQMMEHGAVEDREDEAGEELTNCAVFWLAQLQTSCCKQKVWEMGDVENMDLNRVKNLELQQRKQWVKEMEEDKKMNLNKE